MAHCSHGFAEMVEKAQQLGCTIIDKGNTLIVRPPNKELGQYTCHKGERGLHPLRRFLENTCKFDLTDTSK